MVDASPELMRVDNPDAESPACQSILKSSEDMHAKLGGSLFEFT